MGTVSRDVDVYGYLRVPKGQVQFYASRLIRSIQDDLHKFTVVTNLGFQVTVSAEGVRTVTVIEE